MRLTLPIKFIVYKELKVIPTFKNNLLTLVITLYFSGFSLSFLSNCSLYKR